MWVFESDLLRGRDDGLSEELVSYDSTVGAGGRFEGVGVVLWVEFAEV